ncbi:rhodanese-like domain-containing protein [Salinispirillum marinum]|uniref:Rhodanese-like domain-containing protein n=2 Tax=Saccharospirillaceae TaxID=255527 RepID=A0ABV8BA54_9GAMM
MMQFFAFISEYWMLASAWLAFFFLLILSESSRGGKGLSPQETTNMVNSKDAVVIDIRKDDDFRKGHIPNAINIPATAIKSRLTELEKYKTKPIIVVCQTGTTANSAGAELRKAGFSEVYRMKGGLLEWQSSRMPLVKS